VTEPTIAELTELMKATQAEPDHGPPPGTEPLRQVSVPRSEPEEDQLLRSALSEFEVVSIEEFAAVEEEGAEPLLGDTENVLIPRGGNMMVYGDGGAGKTTLEIDLACHLAAGDDWLGIHADKPLRVLLIENEGPRPLFRAKLRRKLAAWTASPIEGRVRVVGEPWARFTFAEPEWCDRLAATIQDEQIDIVIVGPLTALGMLEAGNIPQVRAFADLLDGVRVASVRRVTIVLIHHENKGGKVSGAWEGVGEGFWHVQKRGHGHTALYFQKAKWSSAHHGKTLELLWAEGEGFVVEEREKKDDATVRAEILDHVQQNPGTGWKKVEDAGIAGRAKCVEIREALFAAGELVNLTKDGEPLTKLEDRKQARLYVADDPAVHHLGRDSGPDAAQTSEELPL
jgi:AAA domain